MSAPAYFLGLISGTSLDGIDAAILAVEGDDLSVLASHGEPYPTQLRDQLRTLCQPGNNEIEQLGIADREVGRHFAAAALGLIERTGLAPEAITAIGSHGQTLRHRPEGNNAFTLQIGDPNTIAELTGITTVADFRRRDIAAGGQGAPLAPGFHRAAFAKAHVNTAVVNVGGIANITLLSEHGATLGFDTGPGNTLMDAWIGKQRQQAYDKNGDWARQGSIVPALLSAFLEDPYFAQAAPKSTGPEYFSPHWLEQILSSFGDVEACDVQRTLLELTAQSIANAITDAAVMSDATQLAVCGGGAHNGLLMERLASRLPALSVQDTGALGIHPDWVEAACFAWLAAQTLAGKAGNEPRVTGACDYRVLGAIYPA